MLRVLLATVLTIDFTAKFPNEGSYWLPIAIVRTAGMVMGDLLGLQRISEWLSAPVADPTYGIGRFLHSQRTESRRPFCHEKYGTFKSLSLRRVQPLSHGLITDDALAKIDADLATVHCDVTPADPEVFRMEFGMAFGLGPTGASPVGRDGYVAWRSTDLPSEP
jgi:hypothetical protein